MKMRKEVREGWRERERERERERGRDGGRGREERRRADRRAQGQNSRKRCNTLRGPFAAPHATSWNDIQQQHILARSDLSKKQQPKKKEENIVHSEWKAFETNSSKNDLPIGEINISLRRNGVSERRRMTFLSVEGKEKKLTA
jgi:hypothetical protein